VSGRSFDFIFEKAMSAAAAARAVVPGSMKVKTQAKVAHITNPAKFGQGIAKLKPTTAAHSWEGVGLSVTYPDEEHVDAWGEIARIGLKAVVLARRDGRPGKFAVFGRGLEGAASEWGIKNGWLVRRSGWKVTWIDEEDGEERWFEFDTEKKARQEAQSKEEDGGAEGVKVSDITLAYPTAKLTARFRSHFPKGSRVEPVDAVIETTNLYVAAARSQLDGIWWNDRLDPGELSAPRGVIFPHAVSRWKVVGRL
jgi:hypothetical protein